MAQFVKKLAKSGVPFTCTILDMVVTIYFTYILAVIKNYFNRDCRPKFATGLRATQYAEAGSE